MDKTINDLLDITTDLMNQRHRFHGEWNDEMINQISDTIQSIAKTVTTYRRLYGQKDF